MGLISDGAYRAASYLFYELTNRFAPVWVDRNLGLQVLSGFEKAAGEFRRGLDQAPHSLSYFEVLFRGLGLECDAPQANEPSDIYSTWSMCCDHTGVFGSRACNIIFEMMAHALGRGRHQGSPQLQDEYYRDMSELWAFHHFTPSVLMQEHHEDPEAVLARARGVDAELAGVLEAAGEPTLGIVWGDSAEAAAVLGPFKSPKFFAGVYLLTLLLSEVRQAASEGGGSAGQALDLVEIGAGFGTFPRLIAESRRHLGKLPPERRLRVRSYQILDVRSVIDLQRWYLNRTSGPAGLIQQRDWLEAEHEARVASAGGWGAASAAGTALWPPLSSGEEALEGPLPVDFVDTDARDLFSHLYGEARAQELAAGVAPVRALVAVNSWHEFTMADFLWYYNNLVAAPVWRGGVDWILYVSNRGWAGNAEKEALLLEPRPHFRFEVTHERCTEITCIRVLRRAR